MTEQQREQIQQMDDEIVTGVLGSGDWNYGCLRAMQEFGCVRWNDMLASYWIRRGYFMRPFTAELMQWEPQSH